MAGKTEIYGTTYSHAYVCLLNINGYSSVFYVKPYYINVGIYRNNHSNTVTFTVSTVHSYK